MDENNTTNQTAETGDVMDKVQNVNLVGEMRKSFIDYAMSVIVARALPDVRDGLKPVHRRILHSMNELNLDPSKPYKKSARIVGDTMGKYHPHGETSIYDALVRMAQDFSIRYMLVDGHGNFGSLDGDMAAAQRYTEARLSKIAVEMIADIEKDTVDFVPNYDEEFKEPSVLPSRFPNLIVNGSVGIAVGMATNIPPHNLTEAIDAIIHIINNIVNGKETEIDELLPIVKGPDFPTGATILGTSGIKAAYRTGRGKITVRALAEIQPMGNSGREMIVVTEIPYQVNKARLLEKIADLVKEKKIDGISDLRDETARDGVRIVIELKKDHNANVVLNNLYKHSQLQENFGVIMLALVNGEPKTLNLLQMLEEYLKHQKSVVTRRTQFDLDKAQKRAHTLQGFLKALDHIDEIIAIIRRNREIAKSKEEIIDLFGFTQIQADAIVEMRLRALSGLERERLEKEFSEIMVLIAELSAILADEKLLYGVIKDELLAIKEKYGDERRTKIVPYEGDIDIRDLIDEEASVITMTSFDYIKRQSLDVYKSQNRGGKGIMGMTTRDEDLIKKLFIASTHDEILFFTDHGKVYRLNAYEIPETGRMARGTAIVNLLNLDPGEKIAAVIPIMDYEDGFLTMITKQGVIKKTPVSQFSNIRQGGLIALTIRDGDELCKVLHSRGGNDVIIVTSDGSGVLFNENDVRPMGRQAAGVRGIKLREGDYVIGAELIIDGQKLLTVSSLGYGKCTDPSEFRTQKRGGLGVRAYKVTEKSGKLVGIAMVGERDEFMIINSEGVIIRIRVSDIRETGRVASGVRLIKIGEDVHVVGMAKIDESIIADEADDITGDDILEADEQSEGTDDTEDANDEE